MKMPEPTPQTHDEADPAYCVASPRKSPKVAVNLQHGQDRTDPPAPDSPTDLGQRVTQRADELGRELTAEEMIPLLCAEIYSRRNWHALSELEKQLVAHLERALLLAPAGNGFTGCAIHPSPGGSLSELIGVKVRYAADFLGEGFLHHDCNDPSDVFPKAHLNRIPTLHARRMANATVEDGRERRRLIWEVTPVFRSTEADRQRDGAQSI